MKQTQNTPDNMTQNRISPVDFPNEYMWIRFFHAAFIDGTTKIEVLTAYLIGLNNAEQEAMLKWWVKLLDKGIKESKEFESELNQTISDFISEYSHKDKSLHRATFFADLPKYLPQFHDYTFHNTILFRDKMMFKDVFSPIGMPYDKYTFKYVSEILISQRLNINPILYVKYYKIVKDWIEQQLRKLKPETKTHNKIERIKVKMNTSAFIKLMQRMHKVGLIEFPILNDEEDEFNRQKAIAALQQAFELNDHKGIEMSTDNAVAWFRKDISAKHTTTLNRIESEFKLLKKKN